MTTIQPFVSWEDAQNYVREEGSIRVDGKIAIAYVAPSGLIRLRPSGSVGRPFYGGWVKPEALSRLGRPIH